MIYYFLGKPPKIDLLLLQYFKAGHTPQNKCMVVDEIGVVSGRTFVSTLFATLLRNQKNYRDTVVPVLASVL